MGVGGTPARDKKALDHSLEFLRLVRDVARRVDLTVHRREVLNGAFELCADAAGPVAERVPRVRAALERKVSGDLKPMELLSLGEIGRAWRLAALNLESGRAHDRAAAAMRLAAPVAAHTAHLSPRRLTLLADERNADDLLGANVARCMREHLLELGCEKCKRLAEDLGLKQLLRSGETYRPDEGIKSVAI